MHLNGFCRPVAVSATQGVTRHYFLSSQTRNTCTTVGHGLCISLGHCSPSQARRAAASNFANKTRKQQCDVTTTIFFIGLWHHANRILCDIIFFCCFSSLLVRPPVSQQTAKHCGGCSPPFPVSIGASLPLTNFPLPLSAFCAAVRPLFGKPPSIAMLWEFGVGRGGQHMCWREESQGSSPLPYLNRKLLFCIQTQNGRHQEFNVTSVI